MTSNQKKSKSRYNIISLYSGAGGLDYGFELSGRFKTVLCLEFEKVFCSTLKANQKKGLLADACIRQSDIQQLMPNEAVEKYSKYEEIDGIIGGPPCESFSNMGRKLGSKDPRSINVFTFMEWVVALRPRFFLMENVPRMAKYDDGGIVEKILEMSRREGFKAEMRVLNASHYGAATKRQRLFILGFRGNHPPNWPKQTHGETDLLQTLETVVSVRKAWENLPEPSKIPPGEPQGHLLINHTPQVIERFASLEPGQYDHVRKRSKLVYNEPSPALVAGNLKGIRSHIHPEFPRELTNRESARLHGFPDNFEFCGNHAAMGKQIANSVPIPLARALAEQIATQLHSII